jgi:hypothetical protein
MSRLLKIGYFATHTDRIKTADIAAWNTLLDSMDALATTPGSLLNNTKNTANETKTYPISTTALSTKKFKKVSDYITAMTTLSDSETAFTTNVAAMLDAMRTYQFIETNDKDNFLSKNTTKMVTVSKSIQDKLKARFSDSMMGILTYYRQQFGETVYTEINKANIMDLFQPPLKKGGLKKPPIVTIQYSLELLQSILKTIYIKLLNPSLQNDHVGIYKLDKARSAILLPFLDKYVSEVRKVVLTDEKTPIRVQTPQPFLWFQKGYDIKLPTALAATLDDMKPTKPELKTITDFFKDKDTTVFLFAQLAYPEKIENCKCLLFDYTGPQPSVLDTFNKNFKSATNVSGFGPSGYALMNLGMTARHIPPFDIQTHLSVSMLQFMTLLAAVNKTVDKTKRYTVNLLPVE